MAREIVRDPVYKQVTDLLIELVRSEFTVGERFLTERQVSERFGISRTTANKALSNLVVDGVLEFRTGVGTFVAAPRPTVDLRRLVSFTEKARNAGLVPETRVRSFRTVTLRRLELVSKAEVEATLGIDVGARVYAIERLRSIGGEVVIYERRALREDLCPGLTAPDVGASLYNLLLERYGHRLEGVAQRIRARGLAPEEASLLGVPENTAALWLTGVGYLAGGTPLWYEETLYRGDAYEFVNQLRIAGDASPSAIGPRETDAPSQGWYRWE